MTVLEKNTRSRSSYVAEVGDETPAPSAPPAATAWPKVHSRHLEQLAVVYVRQSTPQQVLNHRESTELQYKLSRRAQQMGWRQDRVIVIDEDLGQTATTAEHRLGFQRLMAEVSLNHVGIVLGIEMSRLARSNKDWHQLLELCAIFDTLLADQNGLYDTADYNDRLLLGLTGIMNEAELHIIRNRMIQGKRNKAERGELFSHLPRGFVRTDSGEVILDPDEEVRAVMRLALEQFEVLGSGRKLLGWLLENDIRLPVRPFHGPDRGQLQWRPAALGAIYQILHHPIYAGAYSYGRCPVDPRLKIPGRPSTGRRVAPMDQWQVLKRDHLPAYISWEQYLANLRRLAENASRFRSRGAVRQGEALLGGLVTCQRCGLRMMVVYSDDGNQGRYVCRTRDGITGLACQSVQAKMVDRLVTNQVLQAIQPAGLELSLAAAEELDREHRRLDDHWRKRLERAAYEVQRARRQYDAVEPENRLVARELEKCWEEVLCEQQKLEEDYHRFQHDKARNLASEDRERILSLASDVAALWESSVATPADRKAVIRCLVERVVVQVPQQRELVEVTIRWAGGFESCDETKRSVARYEQLYDYDRLRSRIVDLRNSGLSAGKIADRLNAEGFCTPRRKKFQADTVRTLWSRWNMSCHRDDGEPEHPGPPGVKRWSLPELVQELDIPATTLARWCRCRWVYAVQGRRNRWNIWANAEELVRLRRLHTYQRRGCKKPYPAELTTPNSAGRLSRET
jgi:DNA invertase Pin-like site-specific DNA recombinase